MSSPEHRPPAEPSSAAHAPASPSRYAEDEISLYDLWNVLVRRRWVILGVTAVVTLLGTTYALTRSPEYRYSAAIEVGTTYRNDAVTPVASPEAVAARIRAVHLPEAIAQVSEDSGNPQLPHVQIQAEESSPLVLLSVEGPEENAQLYYDVMHRVRGRLQVEHAEALEDGRRVLESQLEEARQQVDILDTELERLQRATDEIAAIEASLQAQLTDLEEELQVLRAQRAELARREGATQALMALNQSIGDILRQRTETHASLETRLAARRNDLLQTVSVKQSVRESRISSLVRIRSGLSQLVDTRFAREPRRSLDEVGPGHLMIGTLSLFLGLLLGVFAALLLEFSNQARNHARDV